MSSWKRPTRFQPRSAVPSTPVTSPISTTTLVSPKKQCVYYLTNVTSGGSYKYIRDLITNFPQVTFLPILTYGDLHKHSRDFDSHHILLVQYFVETNITQKMIIEIVQKTRIQLVIPIHDFYFLSGCTTFFNPSVHNCYLTIRRSFTEETEALLRLATYLIFPSTFVQEQFGHYLSLQNTILCPHIDYPIAPGTYIPPIHHQTIHCGLINELTECKGLEFYQQLCTISSYKGYHIVYHVFTGDKTLAHHSSVIVHPRYNNEAIINDLRQHGIHSLLFLSKWGETYCYSLTHALRSCISILYSNIGAFTERIPKTEHHFPVPFDTNTRMISIDRILEIFYKQLDYLIASSPVTFLPTENQHPDMVVPVFYKTLFA